MSFTSEANPAGNKLLRLVSGGNAIIAELLRLGQYIPEPFKSSRTKYSAVIMNHDYFKKDDWFEDKIHSSSELLELDHEFKELYLDMITRFYNLFESIHQYQLDFKRWLRELEEGFFVQLTLDTVLNDVDGKQLVAEALYLFGIMLLLMDKVIPGTVRERIITSYYRYKGPAESPMVEDVRDLLARTGYLPPEYRPSAPAKGRSRKGAPAYSVPQNYPHAYFARAELPKEVVEAVIGRLRLDDIYAQIVPWPIPEHRSTALANQAAMLYVLLYFVPEVLAREKAIMREVVDKHFADNWIISMYLGYPVDLSRAWAKFPAAAAALASTHSVQNVQNLTNKYMARVPKTLQDLDHLLTEGVVTEEYVLDNTQKCLNTLRHANDTLRWVMLHTTTKDAQLRPIVLQRYNKQQNLELLMKTAQFEQVMFNMFKRLLGEKEHRWEEAKEDASGRMQELSVYFSGNAPLVRCTPNAQLETWFASISGKVADLDYQNPIKAGRKIQQLIHALQEVEQFEEIDTQAQVKQFLEETREQLRNMVRIVNILEDRLSDLFVISDTSYVWQLIHDFVPLMQNIIQQDPRKVLLLRSTFLKLSSLLQQTCVRINQITDNPDLFSVSAFYSGELVKFVRKVLDIVPRTMFDKMKQIIEIQTTRLLELPPRVEKERLLEVANYASRYQLAKLTYEISLFTEGILSMDTTLFGIIKVDPKNLLEDGIRKELVRNITLAMDQILVFPDPRKGPPRIEQFEATLRQLSKTLSGYKRSFEYISDYVSVYGLKIWQEEFSRVMNFFVERECAVFLKQEIAEWQSQYWDDNIPIPPSKIPAGDKSQSFVGRLTHALLKHTHYSESIYLDSYSAWYSHQGRELVGIRTFALLLRSVGVFGLSGMNRLLCFMLVALLQRFTARMRDMLDDDEEKEKQRLAAGGRGKPLWQVLDSIASRLQPTSVIPRGGSAVYAEASMAVAAIAPQLLDLTGRLGHASIVRRQIARALNYSSTLESGMLSKTLNTLNDALLRDIQAHYADPEHQPYPSEESPLLSEVNQYLEVAGISDPLTKIYITAPYLRTKNLPLLIFLFVAGQLPNFTYNETLHQLHYQAKRKQPWYDFTPFVIGVLTLLKQFHSLHTQQFLAYMGQYVRTLTSETDTDGSKKAQRQKGRNIFDYRPEVINALVFLEEFTKYIYLPRRVVEQYLPAYVLDHFDRRAWGKK